MKNIYVVTHTESIHHVEKKVGGWFDTGLTNTGKLQAAAVANSLGEKFGIVDPVITCSDLLRAKETAEIIGSSFGCDCVIEPNLREMSYGMAEGMPQEWLDQRIVPAPANNRFNHRVIEGGESKAEFITRIYQAMDKIIANNHVDQIIVTHGFALTFVVSRWIGLPATSADWVNFRGNAGGITHLQEDNFWHNRAVKLLNEISHLGH